MDMDPNANLAEQRELAKEFLADRDQEEPFTASIEDGLEYCSHVARLSELIVEMDEWLKKGGFVPNDWHKLSDLVNERVVKRIVEVLYPGGDLEHEHGADELGEIANILGDEDLIPRCAHEINHKVGIKLLEGTTYWCECLHCEAQGEFKFEGHTAEIMWKEDR